MTFATWNGGVVAVPNGKPSVAYFVRNDQNQIIALDTEAEALPHESVIRCHRFSVDGITRIRLKRVNVFGYGQMPGEDDGNGHGVIITGNSLMIVTCDGTNSFSYSYAPGLSKIPSQNLLWQQGVQVPQARTFDIGLYLRGSNIKISKVSVDYTVVG